MPRKAVVDILAQARPYGRQAIWDAIREFEPREWFTLQRLVAKSGIKKDTCRTYLKALVASGHLQERIDIPTGYTLVRNTGREAPRLRSDGSPVTQGLGQEQMWRTMKQLTWFSAHDLAVAASTEAVPVTLATARTYIGHLAEAGYLQTGNGAPVRYRLLPGRNTGPKAPLVTRAKVVFDPNLGAVMWCEEVEP